MSADEPADTADVIEHSERCREQLQSDVNENSVDVNVDSEQPPHPPRVKPAPVSVFDIIFIIIIIIIIFFIPSVEKIPRVKTKS